ncbi:MAG: hypothetical protein U1C52_02250 [Patescibacteria group bacterium]|nr:hypothetical protein [Patescibacteria group bacterium]
MNKQQREDYTRTYEQFREETNLNSYEIRSILDQLHRYETSLHRISEIQCSIEMTPTEEKRLERRDANLEKKTTAIAEKLGFQVRFNSDPRGGAIRFVLPSGKSNGWDGETWGIYW